MRRRRRLRETLLGFGFSAQTLSLKSPRLEVQREELRVQALESVLEDGPWL